MGEHEEGFGCCNVSKKAFAMFKARTRSVTDKSITHQFNDIEKQANDRARAAAGHGSSSNLFGAFFA